MNRYWYLTKHTGALRVFQQKPNGYTKFITEVITFNPDKSYQHTLYDRETTKLIVSFSDKGSTFKKTQALIKKLLQTMK